MPRRTNLAFIAGIVLLLGYVVWSWLTLGTATFATLDATSLTPGPNYLSYWGQILTATATLTAPVVVLTSSALIATWAWHRRLKNLAWAYLVVVPLVWVGISLTKDIVGRLRPPLAAPVITAEGWSYPSGHMTALSALAVMLLTTTIVTRRPRPQKLAWLAGTVIVVGFIAYNRWALRAHYITDIVGGTLWGGALACIALVASGVHVNAPVFRKPRGKGKPCAVVVNPSKITDWAVFRRHVDGALIERGWKPEWLETTPDDPGHSMTQEALRRDAQLVLAAGGDGTLRAVAAGLRDTSVPMAILPAGTGNLLARNLGIPLDLDDALDVAFAGRPVSIDMIEIVADGGPPDHSLVMAGMGLDAIIMDETNTDLKKVVGAVAYVMAGVQALGAPPFHARIAVDADEPQHALAGVVVIANVGALQGNIQLFPDAEPDDGIADVLVASPKRPADWGIIASQVMRGTPEDDRVARTQAARVVVETDEPIPFQIDGDAVGSCSRLEAEVLPRGLRVMVP